LAHERGKGAAMEDWLYANQATLTPAGVRVAAREVAGITDFDARYAKVLEQVRSDTALGGLLHVKATPTFFINGVKIDGGLAPQYFDAIVAYELKKTAR
jgi:protein-disulfide isomerase